MEHFLALLMCHQLSERLMLLMKHLRPGALGPVALSLDRGSSGLGSVLGLVGSSDGRLVGTAVLDLPNPWHSA